MHVRVAAALIAIAVALLLWWGARTPGTGSAARPPALDGGGADRGEAELVADRRERATEEAEAVPTPPDEAEEDEPVEEPAAAPEEPAPDRGWLTVRVEDELGNPIPLARLEMWALRAATGGHRLWFGEPCVEETDVRGEARLFYPARLGDDGPTTHVSFSVRHPQYVPRSESHFPVDPDRGVVVLERGSLLIVSGWIDDESRRVLDVVPHLDHSSRVGPDGWEPVRDGRLSTSQLAPGLRRLVLTWTAPDGGLWTSRLERFTIAEQETVERHLELLPARRLVGELSDEVPRPVTNGEVEVRVSDAVRGVALLSFQRKVPVREDGTFVVDGLFAARGELIGMCDGWFSAPIAEPRPDWAEPYEHQVFELVEEETRLTLAMRPTATFRATLTGPDGRAVDGATVHFSPNVHWAGGGAQIFLHREYTATSGTDGLLLVENLLPGERTTFALTHPVLVLPLTELPYGEPARYGVVDLVGGETSEVSIALERATDG